MESQPRPHVINGLLLPIKALGALWRDRDTRGPLLLVISLLIVGTAFYMLVEEWSLVDSVYFCAMSLATVGYGDLVPHTDVGKIFTTVYVLAGIGILVSFFTTLTAKTLAIQSEVRRARERAHQPPG
jgi:voltage-gated potassium channel